MHQEHATEGQHHGKCLGKPSSISSITVVRLSLNRIAMSLKKKSKRDVRNGVDVKFPENVGIEFDLTFNECGRVSLSRASLKEIIENATHTEKRHSLYGTWHFYLQRVYKKKECASVGALKCHMKVQQNITAAHTEKDARRCHISTSKCKAIAGLKSNIGTILVSKKQSSDEIHYRKLNSRHHVYICATD